MKYHIGHKQVKRQKFIDKVQTAAIALLAAAALFMTGFQTVL